jgi:hypothetical protein
MVDVLPCIACLVAPSCIGLPVYVDSGGHVNPLMPRLNTPAQVRQPRFFSGHLISKACS